MDFRLCYGEDAATQLSRSRNAAEHGAINDPGGICGIQRDWFRV